MTSRRDFVRMSVLATAGLAGCLGRGGGDDGDDTDPLPGLSTGTDDELLLSIADPASQVHPKFIAGYQYKLGDLREHLDPLDVLPDIGGSVSAGSIAETFDTRFEGVSSTDVDRIVGSTYRSIGIQGGLDVQDPTGEAVHVTGEFSAGPIVDFFEETGGYTALDSADGFDRFVRERENIDEFRAFAVTEDRFVGVRRTNAGVDPADALAIEFDQLDRDDAPILERAPAFGRTVESLNDAPIRVATGYALVPLGSDTGTSAFDDALRGVVGAGVSATPGAETTLQRAVSYLDADMASESAVREAFQASESDSIPADAWTVSKSGATISARTTRSTMPPVSTFRTALPIPGYGDLLLPVDPADLGRTAPPQLFFQPSIDDGIVEIELVGGGTEDDLQVRYVHDGERVAEAWDGPVSPGDSFRSEQTLDSDTWCWIVWRPDSVDAAVQTRFHVTA